MRRAGNCRTVPHEVPLDRVRTVADAKALFLLIEQPRPEARSAGSRAFDEGITRMSNPHPIGSPEHASWDAGWNVESEANS